jgi:quinol monooxygenase YgiN
MPTTAFRNLVAATLVAFAVVVGPAAAGNDRTIARYAQMPAGAYAVIAQIRAKPGKEDALRAATLPLVPRVRAEPNNLLYFLHEDRASPGHFVFYEIFASQADFEAHNATTHVQAWFARLPELADGGVEVVRMEILGDAVPRAARPGDSRADPGAARSP